MKSSKKTLVLAILACWIVSMAVATRTEVGKEIAVSEHLADDASPQVLIVDGSLQFDANGKKVYSCRLCERRLINDEVLVLPEEACPLRGILPEVDGAAMWKAPPVTEMGLPEQLHAGAIGERDGLGEEWQVGGGLETHGAVILDPAVRMDSNPSNAQAR